MTGPYLVGRLGLHGHRLEATIGVGAAGQQVARALVELSPDLPQLRHAIVELRQRRLARFQMGGGCQDPVGVLPHMVEVGGQVVELRDPLAELADGLLRGGEPGAGLELSGLHPLDLRAGGPQTLHGVDYLLSRSPEGGEITNGVLDLGLSSLDPLEAVGRLDGRRLRSRHPVPHRGDQLHLLTELIELRRQRRQASRQVVTSAGGLTDPLARVVEGTEAILELRHSRAQIHDPLIDGLQAGPPELEALRAAPYLLPQPGQRRPQLLVFPPDVRLSGPELCKLLGHLGVQVTEHLDAHVDLLHLLDLCPGLLELRLQLPVEVREGPCLCLRSIDALSLALQSGSLLAHVIGQSTQRVQLPLGATRQLLGLGEVLHRVLDRGHTTGCVFHALIQGVHPGPDLFVPGKEGFLRAPGVRLILPDPSDILAVVEELGSRLFHLGAELRKGPLRSGELGDLLPGHGHRLYPLAEVGDVRVQILHLLGGRLDRVEGLPLILGHRVGLLSDARHPSLKLAKIECAALDAAELLLELPEIIPNRRKVSLGAEQLRHVRPDIGHRLHLSVQGGHLALELVGRARASLQGPGELVLGCGDPFDPLLDDVELSDGLLQSGPAILHLLNLLAEHVHPLEQCGDSTVGPGHLRDVVLGRDDLVHHGPDVPDLHLQVADPPGGVVQRGVGLTLRLGELLRPLLDRVDLSRHVGERVYPLLELSDLLAHGLRADLDGGQWARDVSEDLLRLLRLLQEVAERFPVPLGLYEYLLEIFGELCDLSAATEERLNPGSHDSSRSGFPRKCHPVPENTMRPPFPASVLEGRLASTPIAGLHGCGASGSGLVHLFRPDAVIGLGISSGDTGVIGGTRRGDSGSTRIRIRCVARVRGSVGVLPGAAGHGPRRHPSCARHALCLE